MEFDALCCYVKDKVTKDILVQGRLTNGLYQLDVSPKSTLPPHCTLTTALAIPTSIVDISNNVYTMPVVAAAADVPYSTSACSS